MEEAASSSLSGLIQLVDLGSVASELPPLDLQPMQADRADAPPADEHRWAYQPCWRGRRAVIHLHGALADVGLLPPVRVVDLHGNDLTGSLPELASMADAGPSVPASLDVVVSPPLAQVAEHDAGAAKLLLRLEPTTPTIAGERAHDAPVHVLVLDLAHLAGHRVADLPYTHRRALLLERLPDGPSWEVPGHTLHPDHHLRAMAEEWRCTDVVAKRLDSHYFPGMVSPTWLRIPVEALPLRPAR